MPLSVLYMPVYESQANGRDRGKDRPPGCAYFDRSELADPNSAAHYVNYQCTSA